MARNLLKKHKGYWLNRLRNMVHYAFTERLAPYDITVAEYSLLVAIYDHGADSVNSIAHYIEIDKASISRLAEKLVAKEVLYHNNATIDKRSKKLSLTSKGKKLMPKILAEADSNEAYFFADLSLSDQENLRDIMCKLLRKDPHITLDGWIVRS